MEKVQNYVVNSKDYVIIKKINGGQFGAVYKVQNKNTNEILAAKVATGSSQNRLINREIKIMIHFDHPTIEKLRGYSSKDFFDNKVPTIFMNFEANGSLRDAIEKAKKGQALENYDNTARQIILIGIARGMMILHKNNVIHRDLKPENILLDENLHPLITDFGLSKFFELGHSMSQSMAPGTCFYMAPEILSNEKYDIRADVYSFGILMYEVIEEQHPYPSLKDKNIFAASLSLSDGKLRPKFDKFVKKSFHKLLKSCLSTDPNERPTFEQIYFKLAYSFDDFIVDDDDDNNEEDEDKYFLPDVDKEKIEEYIKEIEVEKSDGKLEKMEENLNKLQTEFEQSKKENILLQKENQEIKKKYDSLKSEFDEFKKKFDVDSLSKCINDIKDISKIKHDLKKLKKIKNENSQNLIQDDVLSRLKEFEEDTKTAISKSDKLFEEVEKLKQSKSNQEESHLNKVMWNIPDLLGNIYYDHFLIEPTNYNVIEKIGNGRFGSIYLAVKNDTRYALREIGSNGANDNVTYYFMNEIEMLIQIRAHHCICKFYGFSMKAPQKMALEYLENGSLKTIFDKLSKNEKVRYWNGTMKSKAVFGIAAALVHLHNHGIVHRYLTPSCILFDSNYEPRITDFGLSKIEDEEATKPSKILHKFNIYQAPELANDYNYNHLCDNFSYGVILYQIVTGKEAFDSNKSAFKILQDMECNRRPPLPIEKYPKLSQMIKDLWDPNPDNRPELIDIIKALVYYDEPLFEMTDIDSYKKYRERIIRSTLFTKEQVEYLKQPYCSDQDEEYFQNCLKSALNGNVTDMVKVARCYEKGVGIEKDLEESKRWYKRADNEEEEPEALLKLAILNNFYRDQEDYDLYMKEASDYPIEIINCAYLLSTSATAVNQNIDKAIQMLKTISDKPKNNGEAQYLLAKFFKSKGDIKQAVFYFNMARENEVDDAICDYALMLLEDNNNPEGIRILKQAADKGLPMANYNLGLIYQQGLYFIGKNIDLALSYYEVAADKLVVQAMVIVGKALHAPSSDEFYGLKRERDPIRAARLFEYAASLNNLEGLHYWGLFLMNYIFTTKCGDVDDLAEFNKIYGGTPINVPLAIQCFTKAAEAGFVPSMITLGHLYDIGVSGKNDLKLSEYFMRKAADCGSIEARRFINEKELD